MRIKTLPPLDLPDWSGLGSASQKGPKKIIWGYKRHAPATHIYINNKTLQAYAIWSVVSPLL